MNAHFSVPDAPRELPNNIEAEQALLGAMLVNNDAFYRVSDFLKPAHFYEPLHRKIFEVCAATIQDGKTATPITVKTFLPAEEKVGELTVAQYVAKLASEAATIINSRNYGQAVYDLALKRELIVIGENMVTEAYDAAVDTTPRQIAHKAEGKLIDAFAGDPGEGDDRVGTAVQKIMASFSAKRIKPSISLPLPQLREILSGDMESGSLIGMLSASGEGKTSLALQIVEHAATNGHPVLILSYDQSSQQILDQIVSQRTGIENTRIRARTMMTGEEERYFETLLKVGNLPLRIRKCNPQVDTASHLVGYAKRFYMSLCRNPDKPGLIILDHSRKVKPRNENAHEGRIAADMNGIFKQAASEMGLIWFNLMQRSATGVKRRNPRPIDSDIFGGEMGREDYDAVFYLYRGWKYWQSQLATADDIRDEEKINARFNREKWEQDQAELGVLKWRFGDPSRRYRVRFEAQYTRYVSMREETDAELFAEGG